MDSEKITIGLTIGCWDNLHRGHRIFLKKCYNYCDYLIVGIMTDYWIKVQKGKGRPDESLQVRYSKLKQSKLCDKIIVINTLDMTEYLKIADVFIKSFGQNNMKPEYFRNTVILPRTPDISTTKIIKERKKCQLIL